MPPASSSSWRFFLPTPGALVALTVFLEVLLFASERGRWWPINNVPGLTAVYAVICVTVLLVALLLWFVIACGLRRPFRFGLRTLGGLMLALAIAVAWFGEELRVARAEAEAIGMITAHGGRIVHDRDPRFDELTSSAKLLATLLPDYYFERIGTAVIAVDADLMQLQRSPHLHSLLVQGFRPGPAGLRMISMKANLRTLLFLDSAVDDDDLSCIADLRRIEHFGLEKTRVTGLGLRHLADWEQLTTLSLSGTAVSADGIRHLQKHEKLTALSLAETGVGDDSLAELAKMPALHHLELMSTCITDRGLESLGDLPNLEQLVVSWTKLTGEGLRGWRWKRLKYLDARGTRWNDQGLDCLAEFADLGELELDQTQITANGICQLKLRKLNRISALGTAVTWADASKIHAAIGRCGLNLDPDPNAPPVDDRFAK